MFDKRILNFRNLVVTIVISLVSIILWRTGMLYVAVSDFSSGDNQIVKTQFFFQNNNIKETHTSQTGRYESLLETVSRIKRDVVYTGYVEGVTGKKSAIFQVEGMQDKTFDINTQLMDGFIITEITKTNVVLTNQTGNEKIVLSLGDRIKFESGRHNNVAVLSRNQDNPIANLEVSSVESTEITDSDISVLNVNHIINASQTNQENNLALFQQVAPTDAEMASSDIENNTNNYKHNQYESPVSITPVEPTDTEIFSSTVNRQD